MPASHSSTGSTRRLSVTKYRPPPSRKANIWYRCTSPLSRSRVRVNRAATAASQNSRSSTKASAASRMLRRRVRIPS